MHDALRHHIDRVRLVLASRPAPEKVLAEVQASARGLVASDVQLSPAERSVPPVGHGRNLLHWDEEFGFVVVAMVWPIGIESSAHDHGTWGVVGVLEGELQVVEYGRVDDDSIPGHAVLDERGSLRARPGDVCATIPPEREIHAIANVGPGVALSIHTYGRPIRHCRVFDLAASTYREQELAYTTLPHGIDQARIVASDS